jgi:hypothetical protein
MLVNFNHWCKSKWPSGNKNVERPVPKAHTNLPSKFQILQLQVDMEADTLSMIYRAEKEGRPLTYKEAAQVHNWMLLCYLCNHMPPIRLSVLRTVQVRCNPLNILCEGMWSDEHGLQ